MKSTHTLSQKADSEVGEQKQQSQVHSLCHCRSDGETGGSSGLRASGLYFITLI